MLSSELTIYAVSVSGKHPDFFTKRYYGVALHVEDAMLLVGERAETDGWTEIDFEEVTRLGDVSFAGWLSESAPDNAEEGDVTAEPCGALTRAVQWATGRRTRPTAPAPEENSAMMKEVPDENS